MRGDLQLQRQTGTWTFKQVRGDLRLKDEVSSTLIQCVAKQFLGICCLAAHILRKDTRIYDRKLVANKGDDMNDLDVNSLIW